MAYISPLKQRGYVQLENSWGQIPNNTGTATLAGTDAFLFTELTLQDKRDVADRPDKTGSYSKVAGEKTERNGTWSAKMSLPGVSAAGSPPDIEPFIVAAMGKAGTVHAATDVQYDCEDADPSLTIWDFTGLSTAENRVGVGCIAQKMQIDWGETYAFITFSGECSHVLSSVEFAGASTAVKAGLTAFPSEPATPTVTGRAIRGRKGTVTLDGQTYTTMRSGSLIVATDRELQKQSWNSDLPTGVMPGGRSVSGDFTLDDDDSANLNSLKQHAYDDPGTVIDFSFQWGLTAASIVLAAIKNILLPHATLDYGGKRRGVKFTFGGSSTSLTSKDEVSMKWK